MAAASEPMSIRASSTQHDEGLSQSVESALEDLELKYTSPPTDIVPGIMFLSCSPPKGECVKKLRTVVLSHHEISELGDVNMVAKTLKSARDLDLSHNQITDWSEVAGLLKVLPKLKSLSLSFNPLMSQIDEKFLDLQHDLEVLELNGVTLDPNSLGILLKIFPKLKVLQLCSVSIDHHLNIPPSSSSTYESRTEHQTSNPHPLRDLSLQFCQLDSWEKAIKFSGKFENLEYLDLGNNHISHIDRNAMAKELRRLRILCLKACPLNGWESLEALAELPVLEDLRVSEVPFLDGLECDLKHHLLVPRIPNLKVLNGSEITPRYREDCERAFIRFYQPHDKKPRIYERLVDRHGNLEQLVYVDFTPQETVKTRLKCPEMNRTFCIRHRLHITVSQFLKAISKATDIPLNRLRVLHVTPQYPTRAPDELRQSSQFLHTLRIEDNDEFHVFTKIVPPRPPQRTSESRP